MGQPHAILQRGLLKARMLAMDRCFIFPALQTLNGYRGEP